MLQWTTLEEISDTSQDLPFVLELQQCSAKQVDMLKDAHLNQRQMRFTFGEDTELLEIIELRVTVRPDSTAQGDRSFDIEATVRRDGLPV